MSQSHKNIQLEKKAAKLKRITKIEGDINNAIELLKTQVNNPSSTDINIIDAGKAAIQLANQYPHKPIMHTFKDTITEIVVQGLNKLGTLTNLQEKIDAQHVLIHDAQYVALRNAEIDKKNTDLLQLQKLTS